MFNYDEYDNVVQDTVAIMHSELILENIKEQIHAGLINPYKVNYLKDYIYQYKYLCRENSDCVEIISSLDASMDSTLRMIIDEISDKFEFSIYLDEYANPKNIAKSLYKFFVMKYERNIIDFITNYILKNKKEIVTAIKDHRGSMKKSKNVTSLANKMIYSPNEALIISNINFIITDIIPALDLGVGYLEYLSSNNVTINTINEIFNNSDIVSFDEDAYEMFIKPIADKESGYGTIISEVTVKLASVYNKKDDIELIDDEIDDNDIEEDTEEE